jgi:nucleoside-diphosphate-sugar epimerase
MKVLIIGGTGLISMGIIKHLLKRGAEITMFNRGERQGVTAPKGVRVLHGNRDDEAALERACGADTWDVVIDMICFNAEQARADVRIFGGKCRQFQFCSTVCTYGAKLPPCVLIEETWPQEPISGYGRGKVDCEKIFMEAHRQQKFAVTIIRPSHTYGPSTSLIDNLEGNPVSWDRIERGLPVVCAGDGLGLWVSTHRDDCGKLFAYGALNPKTYGQSYNAARDEHLTWEAYFHTVAGVLGKPIELLFLPAQQIWSRNPERFGLLREITSIHGAYDSSKAKRDVPEFACEISLADGAAETFEDIRHRNAWKSSMGDTIYEDLIAAAKAARA